MGWFTGVVLVMVTVHWPCPPPPFPRPSVCPLSPSAAEASSVPSTTPSSQPWVLSKQPHWPGWNPHPQLPPLFQSGTAARGCWALGSGLALPSSATTGSRPRLCPQRQSLPPLLLLSLLVSTLSPGGQKPGRLSATAWTPALLPPSAGGESVG